MFFFDSAVSRARSSWSALAATLVTAFWICSPPSLAMAQDAAWIWSSEHQQEQVPKGARCYFRKTFSVEDTTDAQLTIAADDVYEVYLNGSKVGSGRSSRQLDKYNITRKLMRGRNTIAVRVINESGNTAALAARLMVKDGNRWRSFSTDDSWVTSTTPLPLWQTIFYSDARWSAATALGELGDTAPWDRSASVSEEEVDQAKRFSIVEGFSVERVIDGKVTGSLIAMTFNEFGDLLVSREGSGLLRLEDMNGDGIHDRVHMYCDKVKNCQGILAINGAVYVTADGPDGPALYQLKDRDGDKVLETVKPLVEFDVLNAEHGPHGITMGPDGLIYVVVGNHATIKNEIAFSSPYRNPYEGDLVERYEDPGGHAEGVKSPGGVVLRTDINGSTIQLFAGGIRNAYDLAFNRAGDLFIHDSDMESDMGMTWYRPTQVFHVTPGADLGWRSGWAKWPSYYFDAVPPLLQTGRGSPTGAVVYDHVVFPKSFHGALFLADWSEGRILAVNLGNQGAGYKASYEVFLQGQPLNVTDLDVGPDGALYFVTGGRGTRGGVYRVRWLGEVADSVLDIESGITAVIRQHQPSSAWGRQNVAKEKKALGDQWQKLISGVARVKKNPVAYRTHALQVMRWYGTEPQGSLLSDLARDSNERVRASAARSLGWNMSEDAAAQLTEMLTDRDARVRRVACEALLRSGESPPFEAIVPLLASDDRFEMNAARRLLESIPVDDWREKVLEHKNLRVFMVGSMAMMIAAPDHDDGMLILQKCRQWMRSFVSDRDFLDMIRLIQVSIERANIDRSELAEFGRSLSEEFPTGNAELNRELVRLMAYMEVDGFLDRAVEYLNSGIDISERIHVAMLLQFVTTGWTVEQRLSVLRFLETAQQAKGGPSHTLYLIHTTRDFVKQLSDKTSRELIRQGSTMPNAALGALYNLKGVIDDDMRDALIALDDDLKQTPSQAAKRLQVGIVAILTKKGDQVSQAFLRQVWQDDPKRRAIVALGLSQSPEGENWSFLLRSLAILDGPALHLVIKNVTHVALAPEEPEYHRQVILAGFRLKEKGAYDVIALLEYWNAIELGEEGDDWKEILTAWQAWYRKTYPNGGEPVLPQTMTDTKWNLQALLDYCNGDGAENGNVNNGAVVYQKAACAKCHRFGGKGEPFGPELTSIAKRFTQREIVESILFPSHVISSQYAGKLVRLADGRILAGLVVPNGTDSKTIVQPDGTQVTVTADQIEGISPSSASPMAAGLLENLTLTEVNDLIKYLMQLPITEVSQKPK